MERFRLKNVHFVLFAIILCSACSYTKSQQIHGIVHRRVHQGSDQNAMKKILDFWHEQQKNFRLSDDKDVALALGNTGSGKSTVLSLLIGAKLTAVKTGNYFAIIDDRDKIGTNSSSKTLVPELFSDKNGGLPYYDCPGFNDNRDIEYEITITYFLKKLLNHIASVKFLFTVNYSSVQSIGNKNDFRDLIKHITMLIKDIGKYSDGIALVITKVENNYEFDENGRGYIANNDTADLESIASYINEVKVSFEEKIKDPDVLNSDREYYIEAVKLLKVFLLKDGDTYSRIGLFRKPFKAGLMNDLPDVIKAKKTIGTIANENLRYITKMNDDFGYPISANSMNQIREMIDILQRVHLKADVVNIGNEIQQYYLQQEKQISDVIMLRDILINGFDAFSQIESNDPQTFLKQIINATNVLGFGVSVDTLTTVSDNIAIWDFLTTASNENITNTFEFVNELNKKVKSLEDSKKWYIFLNELKDKLSKYELQDMKSSTQKLMIQCSMIDEAGEKDINDIDLKEFLEIIKESSLYDNIAKLKVNSFKLKKLKAILNEYSNSEMMSQCSSDKLTVRGYNIKLSDITKVNCFPFVNRIEIMALNRFYVDSNMNETGKETHLYVIAPTWEVFGGIEIDLNGEKGKSYREPSARNGITNSENGADGSVGFPGGLGGSILFIGERFINAPKLKIYSNGGNGGLGQNGGNGTQGKTGDDPDVYSLKTSYSSFDTFESNLDRRQFKYRLVHRGFDKDTYEIYGTDGIPPGNGGKSGLGGFGGKPGLISMIGLKDIPNFEISNSSGKFGIDGEPGFGGSGAYNGRTANIYLYSSGSRVGTFYYFYQNEIWFTQGGHGTDGKRGIVGTERGNDTSSSPHFQNPSIFINDFKSYVRENLSNSTGQSYLTAFVKKLENNGTIKELYSTLGFVNELQGLESQYLQFRNKIAFLPFYESLIARIKEFPKASTSLENRKVLNYLYIAAVSQMYAIKENMKRKNVVNISQYLDMVKENVKKFEKIEKQETIINAYRDDYQKMFGDKMQKANEFIQNEITPDIEKTFSQIDDNIYALIEIIAAKEDEIKNATDQAYKERNDLQNMLGWRGAFFTLKMIGSLAGFIGPAGAVLGSVLTGSSLLAEGFILDTTSDKGQDKIYSLPATFRTLMAKVSEQLVNKPKMLQQKLDKAAADLEKALLDSDASNEDKIEIPKKIEQIRKDMEKIMRTGTKDYDVVNQKLKEKHKEIMELSGKHEKDIADEKERMEKIDPKTRTKDDILKELRLEKKLKLVRNIQSVLSMAELTFDFIKRLINDNAKLQIAEQAIGKLKQDLIKWKVYEEKVFSIMVPQMREMENTMDQISKSLNGSTHIELDISKWNIQGALRDTKLLLRQMTLDMPVNVQSNLQRSMEKLEEAMAILIDVYDRIDSYAESAKLAAYIGNVDSNAANQIPIKNIELKSAVVTLERMTQSNLLMEQYEWALHAFKQHQFPFGVEVFGKFELPVDMNLNDTESMIFISINQIESMKTHIVMSEALIGKYDAFIHKDKTFDSKKEYSAPFYVWKDLTIKNEIMKLLNGRGITLKADITKGLDLNAVKFNEIGIHLKLANETLQSDLDNKLKNFKLTMTMIGSNYYRCGNKFYYISVDEDITLSYIMDKQPNGQPVDPNDVYRKIQQNDFFLSPYTMWNIKLTNLTGSFDQFEKFKNETIDLELVGRGQYIEQNPTFTNDICTEQLDKLYNVDKTMLNTDAIDFDNKELN